MPWIQIRVIEILNDFTARCTYSAKRGIVNPFVCPSVTLVYRDCVGWISSKVITRIITLGTSLLGAPKSSTRGTSPNIVWDCDVQLEDTLELGAYCERNSKDFCALSQFSVRKTVQHRCYFKRDIIHEFRTRHCVTSVGLNKMPAAFDLDHITGWTVVQALC